MKNNRTKLTEATMNEIGLQDLLDLSAKVQVTVLSLQNASLKFNDKALMQLATKLNSDASQFHNYISKLVMNAGDGLRSGLDSEDGSDERKNLNSTGIDIPKLESVKAKYLKRKKLKESDSTEDEQNDDDDTNENDSTTENDGKEIKIDLTEPFAKVIEGLEDEEFNEFKGEVVSTLEKHIDSVETKISAEAADEYAKTIEAMDATKNSEDFDFALDNLYNFADKNEIIVETVIKNKKKLK